MSSETDGTNEQVREFLSTQKENGMLSNAQIAEICHEANRAYCSSIGDFSQPPWESAPEWQKESAVQGVKFHLEQPIGNVLEMAPASHENWMKVKEEEGWVYGEKKDPEKKTHHCMVPYLELPQEQRMKDFIFCGIIASIREFHDSLVDSA